MDIKPTSTITFGYSSKLKTLYKAGKFPGLKSFSGEDLTSPSLEHIHPRSKGGKNELGNYVLTNRKENMLRGDANIDYYIHKNPDGMNDYIDWFLNHEVEGFNCREYIMKVINTINRVSKDFLILFER